MTDNGILARYLYALERDKYISRTNVKSLIHFAKIQKTEIKRLKAEIERLQKAIKVQDIMIEQQDYKIKTAKSEARKEFAERLKGTDMSDVVGEQYINGEIYAYFYSNAFERKIDNLLKEMEEQ
jgi:hypothetical protein